MRHAPHIPLPPPLAHATLHAVPKRRPKVLTGVSDKTENQGPVLMFPAPLLQTYHKMRHRQAQQAWAKCHGSMMMSNTRTPTPSPKQEPSLALPAYHNR